MKRLKFIIIVLVGILLGARLAAGPGITPWAAAVAGKAVGAHSPCSWGALLRQPWSITAFLERKATLEAQLAVTATDAPLGLVRVQTPGRPFWVRASGGIWDGRQLIAFLLAEREWNLRDIPAARVRPGDVVLDVGAHVGTFADYALLSGAAKVILLEPDPVNVECLRRNFAAEIAAGSVVLIPEGAWSSESTLELAVGVANSGTGSLVQREQGASTVSVPVRPIDRILERAGVSRVDYIKMDIEGAEPEALKGARQTIARFAPRFHLDANHQPDDATALPALIAGFRPGYRVSTGNCEVHPAGGYRPHTLFLESN
jgi:FkbM family methyltransferase